MRRVCAWCEAILDGEGPLLPGEEATHGMCKGCFDKQMADLRAMPTTNWDEIPCVHGTPGGQWCTACEAEV